MEIYGVFLRISAVTIGGGYVMFPMLRREVVEGRGWISDEEMIDYYALGQSIPGIIAMNTVTLIGYRKRGIPGRLLRRPAWPHRLWWSFCWWLRS